MEVELFCCYIFLLIYFDRFVEYLGVSICCKYMCVCMCGIFVNVFIFINLFYNMCKL